MEQKNNAFVVILIIALAVLFVIVTGRMDSNDAATRADRAQDRTYERD
jgi:uncharacterized membrane protein